MTQIQDAPTGAPENTSASERPNVRTRLSAWASGLLVRRTATALDHPEPADPQTPAPPAPEPVKELPAREVNAWAKTRTPTKQNPVRTAPDRSRWAVLGVAALGVLVLAIVAVGLYTSLGALRDTGLAAHIEEDAANLWWIGIDGLIVVAIVSVVILRHDAVARRYALGVVVVFTAASGFLQYLHGLGMTTADRASEGDPQLPEAVVALVAALVIGTIFCGTHLLVYVLRHLFPRALSDQVERPGTARAEQPGEVAEHDSADSDTGDGSPAGDRSGNERGAPAALAPDPIEVARLVYAACLDADVKLTRKTLAEVARISERQAGHVRTDVDVDRAETAERERLAEEERAEAELLAAAAANTPKINGSPIGSGLTTTGGAP